MISLPRPAECHRSPRLQRRLAPLVAVLMCLSLASNIQPMPVSEAAIDNAAWFDVGVVYMATSGDAYYPSVIYDANGFGRGYPLYQMWYSNGAGAVLAITSGDGINWGAPRPLAGLGNDAHHAQVLYDADCFGVTPCTTAAKYKMWYWDIDANLYSIGAMATAQSVDGLNWTNDMPLTQTATSPLVTGGGTGWNRGTYGPISVFYQAGATNSGTEPWNYSYTMYYDGTDGSSEVTGLAYSADGVLWTAYSTLPVLDKGTGNSWDCDDAAYGTVYHDADGYHYWYSGGGGDNGSGACAAGDPVSEGIGYAFSTDGKSWTKSPNPIFHISDGVSYRSKRVYTPALIDDGSGILKMYYTALASGSGLTKKIALAVGPKPPLAVWVDQDFTAGNAGGNIWGFNAFVTLQAAINAVAPGGVITVAEGTYAENPSINKALTLRSASGAATTIIDGNDGDPYGVFIAARNVTLEGFTITNPGYTYASDASGIVVAPPAGPNSNIRLTHNIIHDVASLTRPTVAFGTVGINVGPVDGLEIDNNVIYNVQHSANNAWANGISIWGNSDTEKASRVNIHNNTIYSVFSPYAGDAGISTQDFVEQVNVRDNSLTNTGEFGVEVRGSQPLEATNNWWGSVTGPTHAHNPRGTGAPVTDRATFAPWLCDGADALPETGFQPNAAACTATYLVFSMPPGGGLLGQPLAPQPSVNVLDADGDLQTTFTGMVTLTLRTNPASGVLSGTPALAAANGTAAFSGLSIDRAGVGYTLEASAAGAYPATSPAFTVTNPIPIASALSPQSILAGSSAFWLTVLGSNFVPASVVHWNGSALPTVFVNATELVAYIRASEVASLGTASLTVVNPGPGGGPSNALPFTITASTADLSVSLSDSQSTIAPGGWLTYTLIVTNTGPAPVAGATVTATLPAALMNSAWSCAASSGSTCMALGAGNALAGSVSLLAGGTATYLIPAQVASSASGSLTAAAGVAAPPGMSDPDPANNQAADLTTIVIIPPTGGQTIYLPLLFR